MRKVIIVLIAIFGLMSFSSVNAQSNNFDLEIRTKDTFSVNEVLEFEYVLRSEVSQDITLVPYLDCSGDLPQVLPNEVDVKLLGGEEYIGKYKGVEIDESIHSQDCKIVIEVVKPFEEFFKHDIHIDVPKKLEVDFLFCEDSSCSQETKNFEIDKTFFIKAKTKEKVPITAVVSFDNGKVLDRLELPGYYSFKQAGNYVINFETLANVFLPINYKKNIIINNVDSAKVCRVDGKCLSPENPKNCPADCKFGIIQEGKIFSKNYFLMGLVSAVFLFMIIEIIRTRKKDNNDNNDNND